MITVAMRSSDDPIAANERERRLQALAEEIESLIKERARAEGIELAHGGPPLLTPAILKVMRANRRETDAGAALIGAAFLQRELLSLLKSHCVDDQKAQASVLGSEEKEGFLASFHLQIELAFLLGLIPIQMRHDLHLIRKARNRFAHHPDTLTFEDERIRGWCTSFKRDMGNSTKSPREIFTQSVLDIAASIRFLMGSQKRCTVPPELSEVTSEETAEFLAEVFNDLRRRKSPEPRRGEPSRKRR